MNCGGRRREITPAQVSRVRSVPGRRLTLLDEKGHIFFIVNSDMCYYERMRSWVQARHLPIELASPHRSFRTVLHWRNAFVTRLHFRLNAVRVASALALAALWAGCILPLVLLSAGRLNFSGAVFWMGVAPLPLLVCLLLFAPLTAFQGHRRPAPPGRPCTRCFPTRCWLCPRWLAAVFANTVNRALTVVDDKGLSVAVVRLYAGTCGAGVCGRPGPGGRHRR